jgi:hypothetical protein
MTAPVGQRGKGFRPEPEDFDFSKHLGAVSVSQQALLGNPLLDSEFPPFVDQSSFVSKTGGVRDQARGDSCVGFSFVEAFDAGIVSLGLASTSVSSARGAYRGARRWGNQLMGLGSDAPIADNGTAPSYCIAAALQDGVASEASDPYNDTKLVNDQETLAEAVDGAPKASLVVGAFTPIVAPAGLPLMRAVQQALLLPGTSVWLAVNAGSNFQAADGKILTVDPGPVDHMILVIGWFVVQAVTGTTCTLSNGMEVGFQVTPNVGDVVPLVRNSYGPGWSAGCPVMPGLSLVDPAFLNGSSFQYAVQMKATAGAK